MADTKMNDPGLQFFYRLLVTGAQSIRNVLLTGQTDEAFLNVDGSMHVDARAFVIYGALDEAEKVGLHLLRLDELLYAEPKCEALWGFVW